MTPPQNLRKPPPRRAPNPPNVPLMNPPGTASMTSRAGAARCHERRPEEPRRVPLELNEAPVLDWPAAQAAFRSGDRAAAEVVATRLAPFVAQLVRRLTAWRGEVDDLVQDVLVAALAARRQFRG